MSSNELHIIVSKFICASTPSFFSQVYENIPSDLNKKGALYLCVTVQLGDGSTEVNSIVIGREIAGKIIDEYYQFKDKTPQYSLREAVLVGSNLYNSLDVQISAAVYVDGVVFVSSYGGSCVEIFRNNVFASIMESDNGVISARGIPKSKDLMILSTKNFLNFNIRSAISNYKHSDWKETSRTIETEIKKNGLSKYCAIILRFEKSSEVFVSSDVEETLTKVEKNIKNHRNENKPIFRLIGYWNGFLKKTPQYFSIGRIKKMFLRDEIVNLETFKNRRKTLILGLVILGLLFITITTGLFRKYLLDKNKEFDGRVYEVEHLIDEAVDIYSLNPERARELFKDAKEKLEFFSEEDRARSEAISLSEKIRKNAGNVLGEHELEENLFLDLSLVDDDFMVDQIGFFGNKILVFDKIGKRVITVDMQSKRTETVSAGEVLNGSLSFCYANNKVYILKTDGIYDVVRNGSNKVVEGNFSEGSIMSCFSGNIYVLDKKSAVIKKTAYVDGRYGSVVNWLKEGIDKTLLDSIGFSIDGNVWVTLENGEILKYLSGERVEYLIKNLEPLDFTATYLYAREDIENIYIIDKTGKRVVVLSKDGEFVAQYFGDIVSSAVAIMVDEEVKTLFLFTNNKIFINTLK